MDTYSAGKGVPRVALRVVTCNGSFLALRSAAMDKGSMISVRGSGEIV